MHVVNLSVGARQLKRIEKFFLTDAELAKANSFLTEVRIRTFEYEKCGKDENGRTHVAIYSADKSAFEEIIKGVLICLLCADPNLKRDRSVANDHEHDILVGCIWQPAVLLAHRAKQAWWCEFDEYVYRAKNAGEVVNLVASWQGLPMDPTRYRALQQYVPFLTRDNPLVFELAAEHQRIIGAIKRYWRL